ncbi:aminotransferase class I/II-fold pyridoxal phosphate-dependent enzyme [Gemmobacter sp.]|uniref:aminotransferase class I/II-fold pyridoxal phosphate-dependent enzyme n=1 Tax=Gemmobacter sp. TaxID=1898957 RepID=UPI002B002654|nr:aminotransferase class I/II-fold pyridoxal phosphate-dependent enzyme [Gemmobacter sp.]
MSIPLSDRVTLLKPSASIAAKAIVNELRAQGRKIIDFTIGEPDLDTPPAIVDAAIAALRAGDTHYTASNGTAELRAAIAAKFRRENGLVFGPDEIVVGLGAKQLIFETFAATLNDGDEVIVPAPFWVSYPDIVRLNGGTPVILPCPAETGFKLTPAALAAAITPRTRWLILCAPSNPTGAIYSTAELAALAAVLLDHPQVAVLTDDIYEHLVYDGARADTILRADPRLAGRVVLINGMSKAYAMTGWRIGYAAGPAPLMAAITKLIGQSTTCPCSFAQTAAVAALNGDQQPVRDMVAIYQRRRDLMHARLSAIPGLRCDLPAGAFYIYPDVSALIGRTTPDGSVLQDDRDVALYFLRAAGVAVMDGASYGMSPYLRLSFATAEPTIDEGCALIAQACAALS